MSHTGSRNPAPVWRYVTRTDPQAIGLVENGRLDKGTLLSRLREHFRFPDYFGENWDAAYDLLLDQVDQLDGPTEWRFSVVGARSVNETDLADWVQLMTDLCRYADARGVSLKVVILSDLSRQP